MDNLPIFRPQGGRKTVWPLGDMDVGDWFLVPHELREPGRVRNYVMVDGYRRGIKFSVEKDPPEFPGYTRVTRVDEDRKVPARKAPFVTYGLVDQRMKESYGFGFYDAPGDGTLDELQIGQRLVFVSEQIVEPVLDRYVLKLDQPETYPKGTPHKLRSDALVDKRFYVKMEHNGVVVERLPNGMSLQEAELLELMS